MLYQIPYTLYNFNGKIIDVEAYSNIKFALLKNPYLQFSEPKTYYDEHKGEAQITIATFVICLFLAPFGGEIEGTILMLILAMSFIALLFLLISQFSQYKSFQKSRRKNILFLENMKNDILETTNYQEFAARQEKYIKSNLKNK